MCHHGSVVRKNPKKLFFTFWVVCVCGSGVFVFLCGVIFVCLCRLKLIGVIFSGISGVGGRRASACVGHVTVSPCSLAFTKKLVSFGGTHWRNHGAQNSHFRMKCFETSVRHAFRTGETLKKGFKFGFCRCASLEASCRFAQAHNNHETWTL